MFKHILVPLDGSLLAEAALPAAAFLSGKFQRKRHPGAYHRKKRPAPKSMGSLT